MAFDGDCTVVRMNTTGAYSSVGCLSALQKELRGSTSSEGWNVGFSNHVHLIHRSMDTFSIGPVVAAQQCVQLLACNCHSCHNPHLFSFSDVLLLLSTPLDSVY